MILRMLDIRGGGGKFGKNPIQKSASRGVILPDSRKSESS